MEAPVSNFDWRQGRNKCRDHLLTDDKRRFETDSAALWLEKHDPRNPVFIRRKRKQREERRERKEREALAKAVAKKHVQRLERQKPARIEAVDRNGNRIICWNFYGRLLEQHEMSPYQLQQAGLAPKPPKTVESTAKVTR
jgi:hypothetical protein